MFYGQLTVKNDFGVLPQISAGICLHPTYPTTDLRARKPLLSLSEGPRGTYRLYQPSAPLKTADLARLTVIKRRRIAAYDRAADTYGSSYYARHVTLSAPALENCSAGEVDSPSLDQRDSVGNLSRGGFPLSRIVDIARR